MAKTNDNTGQEKSENSVNNSVGKAVTDAVKTLTDALGTTDEGVQPVAPEGEMEYLLRVLPAVAAMITERMQTAEAERKALERKLAAQRGVATKAKARMIELEEASKPRALGPMAAVFDEKAEGFTAFDLSVAIDSAGEVVLAFSDGQTELRGIRPRKVDPASFRLTRGRLLFTDNSLTVTGPGEPDSITTLAGVALLIDGEQAAWSPMAQPIAIGAGQTINLAGSVIFG